MLGVPFYEPSCRPLLVRFFTNVNYAKSPTSTTTTTLPWWGGFPSSMGRHQWCKSNLQSKSWSSRFKSTKRSTSSSTSSDYFWSITYYFFRRCLIRSSQRAPWLSSDFFCLTILWLSSCRCTFKHRYDPTTIKKQKTNIDKKARERDRDRHL